MIHTIVSDEQTGYIRKRYIGQTIRQDVINYSKTNKQKGILLFLDFEKAFDTLEWGFIYHSLRKFNFGPSFIGWIRTLYSEPTACIQNIMDGSRESST